MDLLSVSGISKQQGERFVLNNVHFSQAFHERVAIAGETGSGKSTLLRIIAGLLQPSAGEVLVEGKRVLGPEEKLMPGHPGVVYLSQYFEMPNHYRVEELLNFENKLPPQEAEDLYVICEVDHLLHRYTHELSGGEKQRIGLTRLLIRKPRLLLLDEPFSNLDMMHKNVLKNVIRAALRNVDASCLMVSHDPMDTLAWAQRLLVLHQGTLVQQGKPEEIYWQPVSTYVAGLFGRFTLLPYELAEGLITWPDQVSRQHRLFVRPAHLSLHPADSGERGRVTDVQFLGDGYEVEVVWKGQLIHARASARSFQPGDAVQVQMSAGMHWFL